MLTYFITGAAFAFAASVQPGPLLTYVVSETLEKGWKRTLPASLAPVVSDGPIILLVLLVLSQVPEWFVQAMHFAGALLLFYLAYGAYISWRDYDENKIINPGTGKKTLMKAALVNLLNPNPYIGWSLILGPLFIKGYNETPANGFGLILGFYLTFTISLIGIIFVFAFARKLGPKVNRIMLGLSVIALACFGLYQFYLGLILV